MSPKFIWIAIIAILAMVAVNHYSNKEAVIVSEEKPSQKVESEAEISSVKIGGSFTLTDADGNMVKDADFRGKKMLVFFGFTNCPAICPTGLQVITNAMNILEEKNAAENVTPIFITVDPERDTQERYKEYFVNFHPKFKALTGTAAELEVAKKAYKVFAKKVQMEGMMAEMGAMFDHSSFIYLMDEKGELSALFQHNDNPEKIVEKILEISK